MDALTHAIESNLSTLSTPRTRAMSRTATRAIMRDLIRAYDDGRDLRGRQDMAVASCLAGAAFTRASVGYVLAIAHQFGALYHMPHGLANAIVLPHVLDFTLDGASARLAELARLCGLGREGDGELALGRALIAEIQRMNAQMGVPTTVERLTRADVPEVARRALAEAYGTYPVPKYMDHRTCEALLEQLLPN